MFRITEQELERREARRELILNRICPDCAGYLHNADHRFKRIDKFHWFECGKCYTTMGVAKCGEQANAKGA